LSTTTQPTITLNNAVTMPALGFGAMTAPEQTAGLFAQALRTGYRLIDTAAGYHNEEQVGQGIRDCGIDRDELYLLHWPVPSAFDATLASYRAAQQLLADGRVDAIGVCNHKPEHLRRLVHPDTIDTFKG
jgi:diketogulonate reductase-like aldo/keto reductase